MSVGSPALAAYSLMVTSFNARMVYKRANRIKHEEKADVARALVALQQTPLDLTTDPRLLESMPVDNKWRHEILERLNERNSWSPTTGSSVAWVLVAFVFTLIDSFVSLNDTNDSRSEGLAVGTVWLWLLCLAIGWRWVPTFPSGAVNAALRRANIKAARNAAKIRQETAKKIKERANKVVDRAKVVNTRFQKRTHNPKASIRSEAGVANEVVDENKKAERELIHEGGTHTREMAELRSAPLPSPSPSITSLQSPAESQWDHGHLSIREIQTAQHSTTNVVRSAEALQPPAATSVASLEHRHDLLFIPLDGTGSLCRDEFRHPATFNYARIMRYRVLVDGVFRTLERLVLADEVGAPGKCLIMEFGSPIFNRGVSLSLRSPPLLIRRVPRFLLEYSGRCSHRSFSPFFFRSEQLAQP